MSLPAPIPNEKSDQQATLSLPLHNEPETRPNHSKSRGQRPSRLRKLRIITTLLFIWLSYQVFCESLRYWFARQNLVVSEWPEWAAFPPDVIIDHCAEWKSHTPSRRVKPVVLRTSHSAVTSFELPVSSDKLFLLSRGSAAGSVKIHQGGRGDNVRVVVAAKYRRPDALDHVQVCAISRDDGENGIGIFGEEWSRNHVSFEITVYFPEGSKGSALNVKNFETDLPLFAHAIGDIAKLINFDTISLKTANMPIYARSLFAEKGHVVTSNGGIEGSFNVTSSLALRTSNGHIKVHLNLHNDDKDITDVTMSTSNGPIDSTLKLVSAKETGGKFKVAASTSLGPIDIEFITAPVSSTLLLDAHTALAPVNIQLHKTFEGKFDLISSLRRPDVVYDSDATDPSGKGRKRKVEVRISGTSATGTASWSDDGKLIGYVNAETSLSPLTLKL